MELYRRAQSEGVDVAAVDAAMDGDSAKADIVQLLLDQHASTQRSRSTSRGTALARKFSEIHPHPARPEMCIQTHYLP